MKYVAFISYSSADTAWGRRLQKKLESYRLPVSMCKERGWCKHPLRPVFFAPSDIQPGALSEELKDRLRDAKNLIVICSPSSAQSTWVGEEIRYFHSLGRQDRIHLFIVDGIPNSGNPATECFHPILKELGIPEILGANIHEKAFRSPRLNRERAYIQIITKLLGVDFDHLWNRHKRLIRNRRCLIAFGAILIALVVYLAAHLNAPIDIALEFQESGIPPSALPSIGHVSYTVQIGDDIKTGTTEALSTKVLLQNIPRKALRQQLPVLAQAEGFIPLDTVIRLSRKSIIRMKRNPDTFGSIRFILWNPIEDITAPGASIKIDDFTLNADENGIISFSIPLDRQKPTYTIQSSTVHLIDTVVRPSAGDGYAILFTNEPTP